MKALQKNPSAEDAAALEKWECERETNARFLQLLREVKKAVLIQSIHYTFAPEDAERAEALFRELRDLSRQEPGVITFEVARSKDKPGVFALWEAYRDEASLKAHIASEHFARLALSGVRTLAKDRIAETVFPLE